MKKILIGFNIIVLLVIFVIALVITDEHRLDGVTINLAGRQRMLSQKMSKELLLFVQQRGAKSLATVKGSAHIFDETLTALIEGGGAPRFLDPQRTDRVQVGTPSEEVRIQLLKVKEIWAPLHSEIQKLSIEDQAQLRVASQLLIQENLKLLSEMNAAVFQMSQASEEDVGLILWVIFAGFLVSLIVSILMGLYIFRTGQHMKEIHKHLQAMAGGDLSEKLKFSGKGDAGILAGQLNQMRVNFAELIQKVILTTYSISACNSELFEMKEILSSDSKSNYALAEAVVQINSRIDRNVGRIQKSSEETAEQVDALSSIAEALSKRIVEIAENAERSSQSVFTMASAAEEMSANIQGVNNNLVAVNESVGEVAGSIKTMDGLQNAVRKNCDLAFQQSEEASELAQNSKEVMLRLEHSAQEINNVVDVIYEIADQTNMLALNASIEAATAGAAGSGFAVVANEVKELARQTADATRMITQKIEEIQHNAQESSTANDKIGSIIGKINQSNYDISHSVDEQSYATTEITHSMERVAEASEEVTRSVKELEDAAREVASAATESAKGTDEIANHSISLAATAEDVADRSLILREQSRTMAEKTADVTSVIQNADMKLNEIFFNVTLIDGAIHQISQLIDTLASPEERLRDSVNVFRFCPAPFDVEKIKQDHLHWLGVLGDVILGKEELKADEALEGKASEFGRWLIERKKVTASPTLDELQAVHDKVHQSILECVKKANFGDVDGAEESVLEFSQRNDLFFDMLDRYYLECLRVSLDA
ncbi:methyl-accepting chemotaxis protein [Magnetococcales bacterium HHB-1]